MGWLRHCFPGQLAGSAACPLQVSSSQVRLGEGVDFKEEAHFGSEPKVESRVSRNDVSALVNLSH